MLTLVRPAGDLSLGADAAAVSVYTGLADVITLQRRRQARVSAQDEESFFIDTLSEYQWARDTAGRSGCGYGFGYGSFAPRPIGRRPALPRRRGWIGPST
ncbi:hypothetical protein ADZ36_05590 [Streptomyces fradiae]|uniref:Uncharacterized protein n=1 Tax=Streptomyces fradiae TaxID=1906 RepID=A0ACC4WFE1_STRFR|nr:hypothetical protein ADZ36_05590 [Streptomyces fradiae]OFA44196.1 hypothetical protein BEN35_22580 [Streptomyces fradiae]